MNRRFLLSGLAALAAAGSLLPAAARADEDALAVVQDYMRAWNAHDSAAAASHFADEVVYFDASVGMPITGRDAAKAGVIDNFLNAAPDAVWDVVGATIEQGDKIAIEWKFSGTNTGAWADGTKATGKTFAFTGASIFVVKGGKIESQSDYYDALGFYKQLGLM